MNCLLILLYCVVGGLCLLSNSWFFHRPGPFLHTSSCSLILVSNLLIVSLMYTFPQLLETWYTTLDFTEVSTISFTFRSCDRRERFCRHLARRFWSRIHHLSTHSTFNTLPCPILPGTHYTCTFQPSISFLHTPIYFTNVYTYTCYISNTIIVFCYQKASYHSTKTHSTTCRKLNFK